MWTLDFITEADFFSHVKATIAHYGDKLQPYDLKRFNSNIVDPIKLIFDKAVYKFEWDEIVRNEVFRQRDKSNNNSIGYFHQRIFQYISGCTVPQSGWDVIYKNDAGISLPDNDFVHRIYVEMKNKHNTMNAASSGKTYIKMQGQLLSDDDCACFLVEAIAKKSQNIAWAVSVDGNRQKHRRIRRVSMDEFYSLITGQSDAFYQVCKLLPGVIDEVIRNQAAALIPKDTVTEEINEIAKNKGSFVLALYMLGFESYNGFE